MITPSEALAVHAGLTAREVEQIEFLIDQRLAHAVQWPVRLAVTLFPSNTSGFLVSLLERYRVAGWGCRYVADPREGAYIEFSRP